MRKWDSEFVRCLFVADEKKMVDTVFTNATDSLSDEDKKLPQVWSGISALELLHLLDLPAA